MRGNTTRDRGGCADNCPLKEKSCARRWETVLRKAWRWPGPSITVPGEALLSGYGSKQLSYSFLLNASVSLIKRRSKGMLEV